MKIHWTAPDLILVDTGYLDNLSLEKLQEKAEEEGLRILGLFDESRIYPVDSGWTRAQLDRLRTEYTGGSILFDTNNKPSTGTGTEGGDKIGTILSFLDELEYCYGVRSVYSIQTGKIDGKTIIRVSSDTEAG